MICKNGEKAALVHSGYFNIFLLDIMENCGKAQFSCFMGGLREKESLGRAPGLDMMTINQMVCAVYELIVCVFLFSS